MLFLDFFKNHLSSLLFFLQITTQVKILSKKMNHTDVYPLSVDQKLQLKTNK